MTDTMRDKDTISKGPKKRDPVCIQTQHAITIPAGTILRHDPGEGAFSCDLNGGTFLVPESVARQLSDIYKRVIA